MGDCQSAFKIARRITGDTGIALASSLSIGDEDYLLQITIPNTFFHVAMAYAIPCHNGVDVGKIDFLGPINLVDA